MSSILALSVLALGLPAPEIDVPKLDAPFGSGWGVNIHFTDPEPGEMEQIRAAGFGFIRMDFVWSATERTKGVYDFSAYDRLLAACKANGLRPLWILDYGNDLYQSGSPSTPEARAAFARWAAAAVSRFKGNGILWEIWNEPNIGVFWKPQPDVRQYFELAKATSEAIRRAAPGETIVGPATSTFDFPFSESLMKMGYLDLIDAWTVHPYRSNEPETALPEWGRLRALLDLYSPRRKIPMLSGEWGYTDVAPNMGLDRQAWYVIRQKMSNLASGVPLSILYDWKNDGDNPTEGEHHFGTVMPDRTPKPSYRAIKEVTGRLQGYSYRCRLVTRDPNVWLLLFAKGENVRLVGWTTGADESKTWCQTLDRDVLVVRQARVLNAMFPTRMATALSKIQPRSPFRVIDGSGGVLGDLTRSFATVPTVERIDGYRIERLEHVVQARPLKVDLAPDGDRVWLLIEHPGRRSTAGSLRQGDAKPRPFRLASDSDSTRIDLGRPGSGGLLDFRADLDGRLAFARRVRVAGSRGFLPSGSTYVEGTSAASTQVVEKEAAGVRELQIVWPGGWAYTLTPFAPSPPIASPGAMVGVWVWSDGSGDLLRLRYQDSAGQVFQPTFGALDHRGWKYLSVPVDGSGSSWGGPADGRPRWPVRLLNLTLDSLSARQGTAHLKLRPVTVVLPVTTR